MREWRVKLLFLVAFFSIVLTSLAGGKAFAEGDISISISSDSVNFNLLPGAFGAESQTITASTENIAGYTIRMRTTGPSSALINTVDSEYTVQTFELPTGSESIPVGELGYGYGYSIDGGANYLPVSEPSVRGTTIFKTTAPGDYTHNLTFGVKVPTDAKTGVYTNTFVIEAVVNLEPCAPESICYYGNGDDGTGEMEDQPVDSNSNPTLIPSNFSRPGYGFAGWNTEIDGTGTSYGPSQAIQVGDLATEGLQLYAMWVKSAGNLQNWQGCDAMNASEITALTDTRDGSTYAVAKYADGKCWMMENLRLDLSSEDVEITSSNTNKPTSDFMNAANAHPVSSNNFCTATNADCTDRVLYNTNNMNRNLTPSYSANDSSSSWYSYGGYYNYYTATAGNSGYGFKTRGAPANGDICPAGWKLPTGASRSDDLAKLDIAYGGNGASHETDPDGTIGSKRWRAFPLNFIYSGEQKGQAGYNRGISTGMNTATNNSATSSYNLWLRAAAINIINNTTGKARGQTVRCIVKEPYSAVGNIHYESNGGAGTMTDATNVNFATATAANNQFTRAYHEFIGWNTSANGKGVTVLEGSAVDGAAMHLDLTDGDTLTLYAIWQPYYSVVYDGNGADAGSMASITHQHVVDGTSLVSTNYSKIGYGFAGWSTDATAGTKLQNHETVTIYGPNQYAKADSTFLANVDANNQVTLYAVWLPSDTNDTMQTFSGTRCSAMSVGEALALTDERDSNTYTVTKLADGHCWMTENLRLKPSAVTFTPANTNNPTTAFINDAPLSQDSTTLCNDDDSACIDTIRFNANNINRNLTASPNSNDDSSSWYGYGVMYSWYAATAGRGDYAMASGNVTGDICPAGWRLPTGGENGEFVDLVNLMTGNNDSATNNNMLKFPNNFTYSGDYNHNISGGRGSYGRFWSATPNGQINAYRLGVAASHGVTPANSWNKWDAFAVRCIVK